MPETSKKEDKQDKSLGRIAVIGFFAGLIWSLVGFVERYLNFSKVGPSLILKPWALGDWKNHLLGEFIGILVICLLSIVLALLYKVTLAKIKSIWMSVLFGFFLWVLVFYVFQPWIPGLETVRELGRNTITTTLCLYILYGLFLGYSVSFDVDSSKDSKAYSNK
ncbi:hypothetical protein GMB86_11715 [Terrilactibacillus sp. BCM23-1]|uniref:Uncharacterized protein n=1 Tax=Terrilactibacillus tamarindi TaxID=2599694 RepID=A0A6N8CU77_9BACI|nr:YqhR family membrane protein [Terrilactibacillus tamarindi]MTT32673.1 hypothetical protein [Terrilactibacillus tamarindi]